MTQVVYTGVHRSVEVLDAGIVAERGVPVDVDARVAKRLLAQDAWGEPKAVVKSDKAGS